MFLFRKVGIHGGFFPFGTDSVAFKLSFGIDAEETAYIPQGIQIDQKESLGPGLSLFQERKDKEIVPDLNKVGWVRGHPAAVPPIFIT